MLLESRKHLDDAREAARLSAEFVSNKSLDDYLAEPLLRAGVEREFEIIGEALNRLSRTEPAVLEQITQAARVIAFRNILAHGYDVVVPEVVWDIIAQDLPVLRQQVAMLLSEPIR